MGRVSRIQQRRAPAGPCDALPLVTSHVSGTTKPLEVGLTQEIDGLNQRAKRSNREWQTLVISKIRQFSDIHMPFDEHTYPLLMTIAF